MSLKRRMMTASVSKQKGVQIMMDIFGQFPGNSAHPMKREPNNKAELETINKPNALMIAGP